MAKTHEIGAHETLMRTVLSLVLKVHKIHTTWLEVLRRTNETHFRALLPRLIVTAWTNTSYCRKMIGLGFGRLGFYSQF